MLKRTRLTHFALQKRSAVTPQLQGRHLIKMHEPHTKCQPGHSSSVRVSITTAGLSLCFSNPAITCLFPFSFPTLVVGYSPPNQLKKPLSISSFLQLRLQKHADDPWIIWTASSSAGMRWQSCSRHATALLLPCQGAYGPANPFPCCSTGKRREPAHTRPHATHSYGLAAAV